VAIKNNPVEFRRMAAECHSVARRMSLEADRERMEAMAQRWIELAEQAEQPTAVFPFTGTPQQPQPQQQPQAKLEPEE
jgi:hypothetical protein